MKNKMIVSLVILLALLLGVTGIYASGGLTEIQAKLNGDLSFEINGERWTPRDDKGAILKPISYNGTTYVPLRAVGEAVNAEIKYDSATQKIKINTTDASASRTNSDGTIVDIKDLNLNGALSYGAEAAFTISYASSSVAQYTPFNKLESGNALYIPLKGDYRKVRMKSAYEHVVGTSPVSFHSTDDSGKAITEIVVLQTVPAKYQEVTFSTFEVNVENLDGIILNHNKGKSILFDIVLIK